MARWRVKPGRVITLPGGRTLTAGEEIDDAELPLDHRYRRGLERVRPGELPGTHRSMHDRDGRPDYQTRTRADHPGPDARF